MHTSLVYLPLARRSHAGRAAACIRYTCIATERQSPSSGAFPTSSCAMGVWIQARDGSTSRGAARAGAHCRLPAFQLEGGGEITSGTAWLLQVFLSVSRSSSLACECSVLDKQGSAMSLPLDSAPGMTRSTMNVATRCKHTCVRPRWGVDPHSSWTWLPFLIIS
jgi:hypothetical protein